MPTRTCPSCGSTNTSTVIGLNLDWPGLKKASITCIDGCDACGDHTALDAVATELETKLAPDIAELERYLANGNLVAADRCATRIMRAIAEEVPHLQALPA